MTPTQTSDILDDSLPPEPGGSERIVAALLSAFKFAIAGAVAGAILGHFLVKPTYLSRGYLQIGSTASQNNSQPASPQQPLTTAIVATALVAAQQDSPGISLPSSPWHALNHAAIKFGQSNGVVELSYQSSDPEAAGAMAREIVKAYVNALTTGTSGAISVKVIAEPVAGGLVKNMGLVAIYPLVGGALGVAVCAALAVLRKARL
jgi:capsular polysaccharide biosynthesis protein